MNNQSDPIITCLHPTIEERGKVKEDGDITFKVSLQDCLACSGCAITSDEISIISSQNPENIFEKLGGVSDYVVLVSTPCVANLAAKRNWSAAKAFAAISSLFKARGAKKVVLETEIQIVWRRLLIKEFVENPRYCPFLISRCAGSVIYYQRKTAHGGNLAQIKPYPQLFAAYEKNILKDTSYVLYIGTCYDRKLESAQHKDEIDSVLTIGEINDLINEPDFEIDVSFPSGSDVDFVVEFINSIRNNLETNNIFNIIKEVEPEMKDEDIEKIIHMLSPILENEITGGSYEGETMNKRLTNIMDMMKKGRKPPKPCPLICQIDYCKGGCCSGGGLIRGETPSARRALISSTQQIHRENERDSEFPSDLYKNIVIMGYSTHYESTTQDEEKDVFAW